MNTKDIIPFLFSPPKDIIPILFIGSSVGISPCDEVKLIINTPLNHPFPKSISHEFFNSKLLPPGTSIPLSPIDTRAILISFQNGHPSNAQILTEQDFNLRLIGLSQNGDYFYLIRKNLDNTFNQATVLQRSNGSFRIISCTNLSSSVIPSTNENENENETSSNLPSKIPSTTGGSSKNPSVGNNNSMMGFYWISIGVLVLILILFLMIFLFK